MPLYVPKLAAVARPPIGFPPRYRSAGDVAAIGSLLLIVAALSYAANVAGAVAPCVVLVGACVSSFFYVSRLAMQRRFWWWSRYCSSSQLVSLCSLAVAAAYAFGTASWAVPALRDGDALSTSYLRVAAFALGCFAALHLVYADGSAFLQAFGLKWVNPARYRTCSAGELLLSLLLVGFGISVIGSQVWALWTYPVAARAAIIGTCSVAAVVFLPALILVRSHELHFHHWCGAVLLLPAASAAAPFALASVALEGLAFGLLCEAAATWGLDPWLVPRTAPPLVRGDELLPASTDYPTVVWVNLISGFSSDSARTAAVLAIVHALRIAASLPAAAPAGKEKVGAASGGRKPRCLGDASGKEPSLPVTLPVPPTSTLTGLPELLQQRLAFAGESLQGLLMRLEGELPAAAAGDMAMARDALHLHLPLLERLPRLSAVEAQLRRRVEGWANGNPGIRAWMQQLDAVCAQLQQHLSGSGAGGGSAPLPAKAQAVGSQSQLQSMSLPSPQQEPAQPSELVAAVALYAVLNTCFGGLRAGAVELRNLTSKSDCPAALATAAAGTTSAPPAGAGGSSIAVSVSVALLSMLAAVPSLELDSVLDRHAFDVAHEQWRTARDECEALLLHAAAQMPAAEKAQLVAAWTLQQQLAGLIDGASRLETVS